MTDQNPVPPAEEVAKDMTREEAIALVTLAWLEAIQELGVSSYVMGIPMNESATGHGALHVAGKAPLILNLMAGLIHQLLPQDFENLRVEMNEGAYFQAHRAIAKLPPMPEGKPN